MKLKLMTYNIASGYGLARPPIKNYDWQAEIIAAEAPDILGLNEVGKGLPAGVSSHAGYMADKLDMNYAFFEALNFQGGPYGNAQLSKRGIGLDNAYTLHVPDAPKVDDCYYEHRCVGVSRLTLEDGRTMKFINSHFGLAPGEHINAVQTVINELDRTDGPVILMGDFNMTPDNPKLKPIYDRLKSTDDTLFTIPSDVPTVKIDYIFLSEHFKVEEVYIPHTQASDHLPFVTVVEF